MSLTALVSYDDTSSDHDALMLARIFATVGARPLLVYVRHATQDESTREELEEHEARALLERGARWLGEWNMADTTRIVISASTAEGLRRVAGSEGADLIIFGSEHRTAPGHIAPQRSTQILLDEGPAAVAIAPAGYRTDRVPPINTIGAPAHAADDAALATARGLAEHRNADLVDHGRGVDLLVIGSREEARVGQVMVSARARNEIESATAPVLVVARGVPLRFAVPAGAAFRKSL
jgi:nucleotide-binding universal stress UspA family protein